MGLGESKTSNDETRKITKSLQDLGQAHEFDVGAVGEEGAAHVRIIIYSDTHRQQSKLKLPDGDIFIHCGDFTNWRSSKDDLKEFNDWLGTLPYRHKIVIAGNHEVGLSYKSPKATREILTNCTYIQDELVNIEGILIYGAPWHVKRPFWYHASSFGISQKEIKKHWEMIPAEIDILITHVPPTGILDIDYRDKEHGDADLLKHSANRVKPKLHLFGHNHDAHGAAKLGDTVYVNAAQLAGGHVLNQPFIITYHYHPRNDANSAKPKDQDEKAPQFLEHE